MWSDRIQQNAIPEKLWTYNMIKIFAYWLLV